ncbi:hypothetical protein K7X08_025331 [Anisodus acutangulus]|uniref:Exonuclease domain-containing protein n=1 Tax=Anisodus acutangulus TaxID=402998 RepID=A0A9Q1LW12_9SOLA|nr:hypothetical protein K7X08_025331 [Anisodus acutangulus]
MAIPNISSNKRSTEIVFFDLETNVPSKPGQKFWVLEFGAMIVCSRNLVELENYCTLIRPGDLSVVGLKSGRTDGIRRKAVADAPSFEQVAEKIFSILDGRIWVGYNIQRFNCVRIKAAFAEIGRPAPVPVGIIDSLGVLSEKFGKRAGNMKMASLAAYFGLGEQKHRSLDDVRMNLEVLKHCATVLFLESSLPDLSIGNCQGTSSITTRSRSQVQHLLSSPIDKWKNNPASSITTRSSRGKFPCKEETSRKSPPLTSAVGYQRAVPYARQSLGKVTEGVRNLLCKAQNKPLNTLLKHSSTLFR